MQGGMRERDIESQKREGRDGKLGESKKKTKIKENPHEKNFVPTSHTPVEFLQQWTQAYSCTFKSLLIPKKRHALLAFPAIVELKLEPG